MKQWFEEKYGSSSESVKLFYAPGRVNLIGEHTDYNGGYVFPAALTLGTWMMVRKRQDQEIHLASVDFAPVGVLNNLAEAVYDPKDDWINYPKGILHHLVRAGFSFSGYDVLYAGNLPNGAGLSSSASIQVVTGYGLLSAEGHAVDRVQLALAAQRSENEFLGVQCGIMDQFTSAMGKRSHALLLQCDTLEYKHIPFEAQGCKLIIGNTNKRRGLVDSEYNARRSQCEQAVTDLRAVIPGLQQLGELTLQQYEEAEAAIQDAVVRKRARHVVEEIDRVLRSVEALKTQDLSLFGELMNASHDSLRDYYEVTCDELNVMVEEARRVQGTFGSRMTGAGFGGCTVSLVQEEAVQPFIEHVGRTYEEKTGLKPEFYVADIGDGACQLDL
ncbi:galactokinase [Paenibacillus senegalensis]|uniref:galactokinase n=1 Tax=Paenibacillus senegalensis TaxID=1465766 RepID=UPI000287E5F8|nr:galactokinase [Paenibacillus senegalensis]